MTLYFAHAEFDYVAEAKNLALIHDAIMPKWGTLVKIPQPHPELCSKHLLVMECLDGVKLVDGIRAQYAKVRVTAFVHEVILYYSVSDCCCTFDMIVQVAAATGTTVEAMEEERKEGIRLGEAINHCDPFGSRLYYILYAWATFYAELQLMMFVVQAILRSRLWRSRARSGPGWSGTAPSTTFSSTR